MENPLVSIIVPVYDVEKYLDRCVESIVNQTYKNLEIILVDDGSPDNCPAICDEWAKKDGRIKVIHKQNEGVAIARNTALDICAGDYIGFVDSDDYAENNMFEILLNNSYENNADISMCGYYINDKVSNESAVNLVDKSLALKQIALGDYGYGVIWNKLYKADLIKSIRMPAFACSEDLVFNYYAIKVADRIVECKTKFYHYTLNYNGTVNGGRFTKGAFDAVEARRLILENENNDLEILPYAIKGLVTSAYVVLSGCIQNDKYPEEQDELIKLILSFKKEIFTSSLFSNGDRIKTICLFFSKSLFKLLIKRKHRNG